MSIEHNERHGPSKLFVVPFDEQTVRALMPPAYLTDKNFEIVYCAEETFEDGYNHFVVCYRLSNSEWTPKAQGVQQVLTHQLFIRFES